MMLIQLYAFDQGGIQSNGFLGKKKKTMPTIGSWYARLLRKARDNTNPDYRIHYSYLTKVMRQYVREYNGQMSYFDGQSTFDLLDGTYIYKLRYFSIRGKICKTTCTTNSYYHGFGKNMLRKIVKINKKHQRREF